MRKIALRGLLGQKRAAMLLWSVVALAFLFLVLSTTLITSLQETDARQRVATYGSWQVMAADLPPEAAEELAFHGEKAAVLPMLSVKGADYFAGDNSYMLSVYSPELAELGQLQLKEGRWPEERGEIVLEYSRMAALGLELGDRFTVANELTLPRSPEALSRYYARQDELTALAKEDLKASYLEKFRSGEWSRFLSPYYNWYRLSLEVRFFNYWANQVPDATPFEEMDEEQFLEELDAFLDRNIDDFDLGPYMTAEERLSDYSSSDLLGLEDTNLQVSITPETLSLRIPFTYTVSGVVETYSDRWDSGQTPLPAGFVTGENYQFLLRCQQAVREKYPDYEAVDYPCSVLLSAGETLSGRELWQELRPLYNSAIDTPENSIYPFYTFSSSKLKSQISFFFSLTDGESSRSVEAWLIPGCDVLLYETEEFLSADDLLNDVFSPLVLDQLVSRDNGLVSFQVFNNYDYVRLTMQLALDTARVAFYLDGELCEIPFTDFKAGNFTVAGLTLNAPTYVWPDALEEQDDLSRLRFNRFAFPSSTEGSGLTLRLVTVILFVTTVSAVFQIFFSQMRRRLRRIVLMKSMGAESRQIGQMLGWEFLYFWLTAMPAGALLGLGGAWLSVRILSLAQGRKVFLSLDVPTFLFALAAGSLALLLGMLIPIVMAVGVPLTGRSVRKKPLSPPKKEVRQDFLHVTLRGLWVNRGRALGSAALCVFMMLITVLCLFLGFRFMAPYRESVERDGKPDYLLQLPCAVSNRQKAGYVAELEELGVCDALEVYQNAWDVVLDRESCPDSLLLETAFGDSMLAAGETEGYPVRLYAFSSEDPLFARCSSAVTEGALDPAAFDAGEQVLVLIPLCREGGERDEDALSKLSGWERLDAAGIETSFYAEYDGVYRREETVRPGSTLHLASETVSITMAGSSPEYYTTTLDAYVTVGAVIYYFPERGIWPVSGSGEGYQIVCSPAVVSQVLRDAIRTRSDVEIQAIKNTGSIGLAGNFGSTDFYITLPEGADTDAADTALLIYARSRSMDIEFYHESSRKLLLDGLNSVLLCCLLGLTAVLLALLIFANTVVSDIEQERRRIGILQALGVSHRQFMRRQLCLGLAVSGTALVLANLLLWLGVAFFAAASETVAGNLLWGYPVPAHILLCLLVAAVITLLYVAPMRSLRRSLPVENIKSGK